MAKVIVGLSGGVDSAVAVIKLLEAGYEVEGLFMRNWDSTINNDILGNPNPLDEVCPQEADYLDAKRVSEKLGIKLHRIDFVTEYWDHVFTHFLEEYKNNRTPNPDILCNKEIKFKSFLNAAMDLGSDYIAMGHYARIKRGDKIELLKGLDKNKDQSYFLCQLSPAQLEKALFPLGEMTKEEVRELAHKYDLEIADKKDSTGVCFIGERNFKEFLQNYLPAKKGEMQTLDGTVKGLHDGVMYYTIGQRKGLGIGGEGGPWFVIGKKTQDNILLVGEGGNNEYLFSNRAIVNNVNWLGESFNGKLDCMAKFRYRQKDNPVTIKWLDNNTLEVVYPQKVKAVTPGQAAVFYQGDKLLGGGTIDKVYFNETLRLY